MFNSSFSKWRLRYIGFFQVNVICCDFSVIVAYNLVLTIHFCPGLNLKRLWGCLVHCCGVVHNFHIAAGWWLIFLCCRACSVWQFLCLSEPGYLTFLSQLDRILWVGRDPLFKQMANTRIECYSNIFSFPTIFFCFWFCMCTLQSLPSKEERGFWLISQLIAGQMLRSASGGCEQSQL